MGSNQPKNPVHFVPEERLMSLYRLKLEGGAYQPFHPYEPMRPVLPGDSTKDLKAGELKNMPLRIIYPIEIGNHLVPL